MTNELSNSKKQRKRRSWPQKRRAMHAEIIRQTKPWEQSTGPRTKQGRKKAGRNALKHGTRSQAWKEYLHALRLQRAFVETLLRELKDR
jgi:hypothetical protein